MGNLTNIDCLIGALSQAASEWARLPAHPQAGKVLPVRKGPSGDFTLLSTPSLGLKKQKNLLILKAECWPYMAGTLLDASELGVIFSSESGFGIGGHLVPPDEKLFQRFMHVLWFLCFTYAPTGWKLEGKGLRTLELEGRDVGELLICQFFNKTQNLFIWHSAL